jgi:hypothetical protein
MMGRKSAFASAKTTTGAITTAMKGLRGIFFNSLLSMLFSSLEQVGRL